MRRALDGAYELDDDRNRLDRAAVHAFLTGAYWALGRSRELNDQLIDDSARVVAVYTGDAQVGYARAVSDGVTIAYLADVYVLEDHRGRGLGVELVRFLVEEGPLADVRKWLLHTRDAHSLYQRFGFAEPDERLLERWR